MHLERVRRVCLSLPHATEHVQWGDNLVFKIGGRLFAIANLDPAAQPKFSFKCEPETFARLTEQPDIVPAPYLARAGWVALEEWDALTNAEIESLLATSYRLVVERLPKKVREQLSSLPSASRPW